MKKFLISPATTSAEFFSDIIVTSPDGIWTDERAYSSLEDAISAVGSNNRTIVVASEEVVTDLTIPSNVALDFKRGGKITYSGQLTINTTNISAPNQPIFNPTGSGEADFARGTELRSAWFNNLNEMFDQTVDNYVTVIINSGWAANVTADATVGDNVTLKWEGAGQRIVVNSGFTLLIYSPENIVADERQQIFGGSGTITWSQAGTISPFWFASTNIGDGSNSCVTAFQTAIDSLEAMSTPGGRVHFPGGKYLIDGSVTIQESDISVTGIGDGTIFYVSSWDNNGNLQAYINVSNASKDIKEIHFSDFKILGEHDQDTDVALGGGSAPTNFLQIGDGTTYTVSESGYNNITAEKVGGCPFSFGGGSNDPTTGNQNEDCYVTNCRIYNSAFTAINAFSGGHANTIIADNVIRKVGQYGIEWSSMRAIIVNNIIEDTDLPGIVTETATTHTGMSIIANNTLHRCGYNAGGNPSPSIQIGESAAGNKVLVKGNTITDAWCQGILVLSSSRQEIVIDSNVINVFGYQGDGKTPAAGSIWGGIVAQNATKIKVTNNLIIAGAGGTDNCDYALAVGGNSTDSWVDGNVAVGSYDAAAFQLSSTPAGSGTARTYIGKNYDLQSGKLGHGHWDNTNTERIPYFTDGDTTPSVAGSDVWRTANTGATTITDFDDGYIGQTIYIVVTDDVTKLDLTGTHLKNNLSATGTFQLKSGDHIVATRRMNGDWHLTLPLRPITTSKGSDATGTNVFSASANQLGPNTGFLTLYDKDGNTVYVPYWSNITP